MLVLNSQRCLKTWQAHKSLLSCHGYRVHIREKNSLWLKPLMLQIKRGHPLHIHICSISRSAWSDRLCQHHAGPALSYLAWIESNNIWVTELYYGRPPPTPPTYPPGAYVNAVETDKENKEQCLLSLKVVEDNTKFP